VPNGQRPKSPGFPARHGEDVNDDPAPGRREENRRKGCPAWSRRLMASLGPWRLRLSRGRRLGAPKHPDRPSASAVLPRGGTLPKIEVNGMTLGEKVMKIEQMCWSAGHDWVRGADSGGLKDTADLSYLKTGVSSTGTRARCWTPRV
jgi:hypothetical protein